MDWPMGFIFHPHGHVVTAAPVTIWKQKHRRAGTAYPGVSYFGCLCWEVGDLCCTVHMKKAILFFILSVGSSLSVCD